MPKRYFLVLILTVFIAGCSTTTSKDTKLQLYKQDKKRVDQVVGGNLGNWENSPEIVDDPNRKDTRKIYIAEFTKDTDPLPETAFDVQEIQRKPLRNEQQDGSSSRVRSYQATSNVPVTAQPIHSSSNNFSSNQTSNTSSSPRMISKPKFEFPNFDEDDEDYTSSTDASLNTTQPSSTTTYVDYLVNKDDTLQKISKKFYNGYSKWPKIYEANKELIKDPNFIKPGITLKIPMD